MASATCVSCLALSSCRKPGGQIHGAPATPPGIPCLSRCPGLGPHGNLQTGAINAGGRCPLPPGLEWRPWRKQPRTREWM
eukprot:3114300-Lingulodinium_polyedra.AAC.1